MNRKYMLVFASTLALIAGGCQSIGKVTDEERATGITKVAWDTPPDVIDPPSKERNTIYVQFNDASGRGMEMRDDLRAELRKRGYQVIMDPDTAEYKLQVSVVQFDRRECGDRTDPTGRTLANGGHDVTQRAADRVTDGGILGTIGGVISDVVGRGIENRVTSKEWCMVASFTLAQRDPNGVRTQKSSLQESLSSVYSSSPTSSGSMSGRRDSLDTQSQSGERMKNYWEFKRTLTATTTKWDLKEQEAHDELLPRLLRAAAEALPSNI